MKALNNLVSATTLLATIEALSIGQTAGLDPARMVDILNVSTGMSNSSLKKMHQFVLSGRYESGFGLDLMVKDLATAMDIAGDGRVPAPLSALARETWRQAQAFLGPGQDHTALARLVESLTSVRLRPEQD
jgi:3-hydroxyisobutyrate dehydrogenase